MKTHALLALSLLCMFNGTHCSDKEACVDDKEARITLAKRYIALIDIAHAADVGKFVETRYKNAQSCLESHKANQDEITYNNQAIFIHESEVEIDPTKRISYLYEQMVNEYTNHAALSRIDDCTTWQEYDTLFYTAKRDFAQAVLNVLSQQDQESK